MLCVSTDGSRLHRQEGCRILRDQRQREETQSFPRERPESLTVTQTPSVQRKKPLQVSRKVTLEPQQNISTSCRNYLFLCACVIIVYILKVFCFYLMSVIMTETDAWKTRTERRTVKEIRNERGTVRTETAIGVTKIAAGGPGIYQLE